MFLSLKRKNLLLVVALVFAFASLVTAIGIGTANASMIPQNGKTVVVDAGHGGFDGGVSGTTTGITEADINLLIAKSLRHFLRQAGYRVVMTRTGSDGLYGSATKNRKLTDFEARRKIIEDAKPDLVISIHQNSYPRQNIRGAQVFYSSTAKTEQAHQIADRMQATLNAILPASTRTAAAKDYYIINCTEFPSLLIECGFLTTPADEQLLVTARYQEKVAHAIFSGITQIFYS